MRTIAVLLCMVFSVAFCPIASAAAITVAVRAEAKIRGPWLSLGDIAEVSGDSRERVKMLKELNLGDAPAPGTTWLMNPALLEPKLAASKADFSDIAWSVPSSFKISTLFQRISGKQIGEIAQEYLARLSVGANLSLVDLPEDLQAPVGKLELIPELSGAIRYNVPTTVHVAVRTDGVGFVKVPVQFEVKRYLDVVVAAVNLNAGDILSEQSVRLEKMDAGKLAAGYITEVDKVIGLQLRFAMTPGLVLTERNVKRPIIVQRGEIIQLRARIGELEVAANGVALGAGAAGDLIKVQNSNTKKILTGRVQEDKTVLVLNQAGG